jgi:L-asparagine oxygenase
MDFLSVNAHVINGRSGLESPFANYSKFLSQSEETYAQLDTQIKHLLTRIKRGESRYPITVLKGVKFREDIGRTPANSRSSKKSFETEAILGAIAHGLGTLFAYKEQSDGEIIHNICPVKTREYQKVGECSRNPLAMHMDGASHPFPPDFLLLYCLRGDLKARTLFTCAADIFERIRYETRFRMMLPNFTHKTDVELEAKNSTDFVGPIFSVNEKGNLIIRYDDDLTMGDMDWQDERLNLRNSIENAQVEYVFETFDLAIIENRKCLHGRSPFEPRYDGTDRWLQAAYVLDDERYKAHMLAKLGRKLSLGEMA